MRLYHIVVIKVNNGENKVSPNSSVSRIHSFNQIRPLLAELARSCINCAIIIVLTIGGKEEALGRIRDFPVQPNVIVDSGNGYYVYWIFQEPIINRTEQQSLKIKQILIGIINTIGADRQRKNFDSVMRLPGTLNVKDSENPIECKVVEIYDARFYSLSDFAQYRDTNYSPQEEAVDVSLVFRFS